MNFAHLSKDVQILQKKLVSPNEVIKRFKMRIERMELMLSQNIKNKVQTLDNELKNNMSLLNSLSPLNVVERGFAIPTSNKKIIKSIKDVKKTDRIQLQLKDGIVDAEVTDVHLKNKG
jgi:exodeoxyribonuclease VII large subunit